MQDFETLEQRKLLTAVLGATGILTIVGTSGDDSFSVAFLGKKQIRVSDGTNNVVFEGASVRRISFAGLAGNDLITLGRVSVPSFLNGGDGNDSLSASQGDVSDTIVGGDGDDYLFGGAGSDSLDGGAGGDLMLGGTGDDYFEVKSELNTDDTVIGGLGIDTVSLRTYTTGTTNNVGLTNPGIHVVTDTIYGDIERVYGGPQADQITNLSGKSLYVDGGAGDDTILLGKGNDTIIGGPGRDSIVGGPGNDTIFAKDNAIDTVMGGTGKDVIDRDVNDVL